MPEYLAERYEPGAARDQIEADAAKLAAAAALLAEGHPIEFLGSTFVPGDEASLSRFRSGSAELVEAAHRRAAVPLERVVEALSLGGPRSARASGTRAEGGRK